MSQKPLSPAATRPVPRERDTCPGGWYRGLRPAAVDVAAASWPAVPGWFAAVSSAAEWALLAAAVGLWVASKTYSPLMNLGSALLVGSWLARWVRLGRLTRSTVLDWPLVLFLLSALVAVLVAPDRSAALVRLYLWLGAAAVFYTLVNAGPGSLRLFAYAMILLGAALGLYFASQHNWTEQPAKFAVIGSLGRRLNEWVPDLGLYKPHPNVVAAILALAAPVAAARFGDELRRLRAAQVPAWVAIPGLLVAGLGGLLILGGVVAAESRTSWLALVGAGGLALWWWLARRIAGGTLFWAGIAAGVVAAALAVLLRPQLLTLVFGVLPGPNSIVSRVDIFGQVWRLAQDTPFTGGGLAAFPALYSTYILSIPYLFLTHAHNAYLNVLVEQGWLGLAGYLGLLGAGLWVAALRLARAAPAARWPAAAGALGLAVVLVHGIGEGSLVASRVLPGLLIPAGLALAGEAEPAASTGGWSKESGRWRWGLAGLAAVALLGAGFVFQRPLLAAWHANLGAVAHHQVELAGWPTGQWDDGSRSAAYALAAPELQKAVEYQPDNRTAHHRLGLAAMSRRDFTEAAAHLQRAYRADPGHRGVIKVLAYTYVWLGDYKAAGPLLAHIPEAESELAVYSWWWGTHGRSELAERAGEMASRLGS